MVAGNAMDIIKIQVTTINELKTRVSELENLSSSMFKWWYPYAYHSPCIERPAKTLASTYQKLIERKPAQSLLIHDAEVLMQWVNMYTIEKDSDDEITMEMLFDHITSAANELRQQALRTNHDECHSQNV